MNLYKLTAGQCAAFEAHNESRQGTLLIVCDHADGHLGVDADALQSGPFSSYLPHLGEAYDPGQVVVINFADTGEKL